MMLCPVSRSRFAAPAILLGFALATASSVTAQTLTLTPASIASDTGARAIASADFDRNGWPDLAHGNFGRNSVTVLMNHDGTLSRTSEVPVGAGPFDMATADFNRDGHADLAVANADANTISVLLGRGDGTFRRIDATAPGNPRGVAAADMNNDGKMDLVYAAYASNLVQVLIGGGGGTFSSGPSASRPRPQGVAVADFNRDGRPDVAVASTTTGPGLAILYANSSGTFTVTPVAGEATLNVLSVADLNRDGLPDVAGAFTSSHRIAVYFNSATGLRYGGGMETAASPRDITTGDLDQDGAIDIVSANHGAGSITVVAGRPAARGTFDPPIEFQAGAGARALAAADFNHDGRLDLATGNQNAAAVTMLWNDTVLVRAGFAFERGEGPVGEPYSSGWAIAADINGNGIPDLVLDNQVLLDGTTARTIAASITRCTPGEFNLDGRTDVVCWSSSGAELPIFFGDGSGGFTAGPTLPTRGGFSYLAIGDMNRDGRNDIVVATWNHAAQRATADIIINKHNQWWTTGGTIPLHTWAVSIALADVNNDARLDLLTGHRDALLVTFGDGNGSFSATSSYALPDFASAIGVGDFDHDGWADVAIAAWRGVLVFMAQGGGILSSTFFEVDLDPHREYDSVYRLGLGDMNADGHLDIVGNGPFAYAPGTGQGTFGPAQTFNPHFSEFALVDFDGNGLLDLMNDSYLALNRRDATNDAPVLEPRGDLTIPYRYQFGEEDYEIGVEASDADLHRLRFEWRTASGGVFSTDQYARLRLPPGRHEVTVTAFDDRGGSDAESFIITILPEPEIVLRPWSTYFSPEGTWTAFEDATAADGQRYGEPNQGAPKTAAPLAQSTNHLFVEFVADPNLTYKLWVRGKAEGNSWANDSIWMQFSGATDSNGTAVFRHGTTSGLAINLETCSGCGLSGWGWRDERWGPTLNGQPVLLRFPQGGSQYILIQSREDGMSVDQIILSAEKYRTAAPGAAKNDNTIVKPAWWP